MMKHRKRICILGSTGSIGVNTLRVIGDFPDQFEAVGLSANNSAVELAAQAHAHGVKHLCLGDAQAIDAPVGVTVFRGQAGLEALIEATRPDILVVATVGFAGLKPTLKALELGITVALANKEVLVTAGEIVTEAARRGGVMILPIDSEHNAIFQCLAGRQAEGNEPAALRRILLTASGGPFRGFSREALTHVTLAEALAHPTWQMGRKITIDSATLMNKGFEVIETHHLFDEPVEKIEVVIHPQSVIHSMIEYVDGSMIAQMGVTDMYLPIANVLSYPERLHNARFAPLDLAAIGAMTFEEPDLEAFPCLRYAYDVMHSRGTYPTVLNAANEVAVGWFLAGEIGFTDIPTMIDAALQAHENANRPELEDILAADGWARRWCQRQWVASRA